MTFKVQNAGSYNMYCIAVASPRLKASKPSPANGAEGVGLRSPAVDRRTDGAVHNVYVGTSPELTEADLAGPRTMGAMFYYTPGLAPGQTYYWRVDEVEADMTTVHTGDVWSFTAASVTAWKPVRRMGSSGSTPTRSWSGSPARMPSLMMSTSGPTKRPSRAAPGHSRRTSSSRVGSLRF